MAIVTIFTIVIIITIVTILAIERLFQLFQECLDLLERLLHLVGVEAVTGTRDDVQTGIAIGLEGTFRVFHLHHRVLVALHDEHGILELLHWLEYIEVAQFKEETATERHVPHLCGVGNLSHVGIALVPVSGDTESREDEDGSMDVGRHVGSDKRGHQATLALADKHDTAWIDIGLLLEETNYGLHVVHLIEDRHVHRVVVAATADRAAGEVEGINLIAQCVEGLEIWTAGMIVGIETM